MMLKNCRYIPGLIFAFLCVFTIIVCGFVYVAYQTFTGEVTEKAYQKGLDFGKIYKTSLMQTDNAVTADIAIVNQLVYLKLNTAFKDYTLEAKIVKPVSFEYDKPLQFERISNKKFRAILPKLTPGNWEVRVKIVAGGEDYVFNRRLLLGHPL